VRVFVPFLALSLVSLCALLGSADQAQAGSEYNLYWGNFHAHSNLSDGDGSPTEAFTYARDVAGIDILALSEHNHMMTGAEWNTLGALAASFTDPGNFVALRSEEFGILNQFGHMNIHGVNAQNPNASSNLPAAYNFIEQNNGIGSYNHPNPTYGTHFDNLFFFSQFEEAMHGMEIKNGFYSGDYEDIWIEALDKGWKLAPFGNQDNHVGSWGNQQNDNDGNRIYLTGVYATELDTNPVLDALRNRRFFACEQRPEGDLIQIEFTLDNNIMGSQVTTAQAVQIEATVTSLNGSSLCNRIELWRDGVLLEGYTEIGTTISTTFSDSGLEDGSEHYYFVKGRQVDGDEVWSAPVWVTVEEVPSSVGMPASTLANIQPLPNRPNPFSPETDVRFRLPETKDLYRLRLTVHDSGGRLVRSLGERDLPAGEHAWSWNGRDDAGGTVSSGVYHYRLQGNGVREITGRMVFLAP